MHCGGLHRIHATRWSGGWNLTHLKTKQTVVIVTAAQLILSLTTLENMLMLIIKII